MTRLEKKCFAASTGCHLLLLGCLVFGAAFWKPGEVEDNAPLLEIIPFKTTDEPFSGGGNPDAGPPNVRPDAPVTPPPVAPVVQSPPPVAPVQTPPPQQSPPPAQEEPPAKTEPVRPDPPEVREPEKSDDEALLPAKKPTPRKKPNPKETLTSESAPKTAKKEIKVNLDLVKRYPADTKAARERKEREEAANAARAAEAAAQRMAAERSALVQGSLSALSGKLSKGTSIDIPGTGGEAYANYGSVVRTIYDNAWIDPGQGVDENLTVAVTVSIRRDGSVIKNQTYIVRSSGDTTLDRSVQRALDRVTFIAPFPEGAKDAQRTFKIKFNLRDKRMNG